MTALHLPLLDCHHPAVIESVDQSLSQSFTEQPFVACYVARAGEGLGTRL